MTDAANTPDNPGTPDIDFDKLTPEQIEAFINKAQQAVKSRKNVSRERKNEYTAMWKKHRDNLPMLLEYLYDSPSTVVESDNDEFYAESEHDAFLTAAASFRDGVMQEIADVQASWDESKDIAKDNDVLEALREYNAGAKARSEARKRGAEKRYKKDAAKKTTKRTTKQDGQSSDS